MSIKKINEANGKVSEYFAGRVLWAMQEQGYVTVDKDGYPLVENRAIVLDTKSSVRPYEHYGFSFQVKLVDVIRCAVWTGHRDDVPFTQQFVLLELPIAVSPTTHWVAEADASLEENPDPLMFVNFVAWSSAVKHARQEFEGQRGLDLLLDAGHVVRHMTVDEYVDKWG